MSSHRIEVCQGELQTALETIQTMTDQREEAIVGLDVMINALRAMETGNLLEAVRILSEACLQFGLGCL